MAHRYRPMLFDMKRETMKKMRTGTQIGSNPKPENMRMYPTNRRTKISPPAIIFEPGIARATVNCMMKSVPTVRMITQKSADEV